MITTAQHNLTNQKQTKKPSRVHIRIEKTISTTATKAKNKTPSNNSNQYTNKPHINARTYTCMFSHKQIKLYAQLNLWLYVLAYMYAKIETSILSVRKTKSEMCMNMC